MKSFRQFGYVGLFLALVGLFAVLAWVLLSFSTPRPTRIASGRIEDFAAGQPQLFAARRRQEFYLLNLDGELIALSARSERITHCLVEWQAGKNRFVDPCLGTRFYIDGSYEGGGPPQELTRLPIQVQDGQVMVEIGYP